MGEATDYDKVTSDGRFWVRDEERRTTENEVVECVHTKKKSLVSSRSNTGLHSGGQQVVREVEGLRVQGRVGLAGTKPEQRSAGRARCGKMTKVF